jgi:hypothetical protein
MKLLKLLIIGALAAAVFAAPLMAAPAAAAATTPTATKPAATTAKPAATTAKPAAAPAATAPAPSAPAEAPKVSEKQELAIFALGYYGWSIPKEVLGSIDNQIQKVFIDLGRFTITGVTKRLSSDGLEAFIETLKKAKEKNFVMPAKFQFGEATLTEAEFNKLLGAFIVAVPVVSEFNSAYNGKLNQWETDIKTHVTFIDVGDGGTVIGMAEVKSSGSDQQNQNKSISSAIDGIPMQLQYEVRKIEAFQLVTRVLTVSGDAVKLQLGRNMGIKKGDEYSVIVSETVEGFKNDSEKGLVAIKDVGSEVSTGQVVYSSIKIAKDAQLREIPRLGMDVEGYYHQLIGETGASIPGLRIVYSRGFYEFRPYIAIQVPIGQITYWDWGFGDFITVNAILGGEYNLHMGRLTVTPFGGIGASYLHYTGSYDYGDTNWLSHIGAQVDVRASFLLTRELKVFAEAGYEQWFTMDDSWFRNYGGLSVGAGVAYKL